jgi:prepilin-type N-terminal cleavage/methylation domain-containing protein
MYLINMPSKAQNLKYEPIPEAGFTLIELLISVSLFLFFIASIYGLLKIGSLQKTTVSSQTEVIKNARLSLNTIGRDAVNAGLGYSRVGGYVPDNLTNLRMGIPSDPDTTEDLITSVIAGDEINDNLALTSGKTDVVSFTYRDLEFNGGDPIKLTSVADFNSSGVIITTPNGATANARPYDLYLISDGSRTALGMVTSVPNGGNTLVFEAGVNDPLGVNALFATSKLVNMGYPAVTAKKVFWVSYRVTIDGVLIRTIYGNNSNNPASLQIQSHPIAYNIQNLQIRYLLSDGTISNDPSNASTEQNKLNNVVQIEVTISALYSFMENGVNINKIFDLKSTFSTKNLSYDIS